MASRKTYFGIGWKDPANPESGPAESGPTKADPADRSSPTIVDDEKVAEGLRQLRSWYQGDTQQEQPPPGDAAARTPASTIGGPQARPTAVGHATGPPAATAAQRPFAPDPMRATMYGHDVHQFDLDLPPAGSQQQQPPPASSTALVLAADPAARQQDAFRNAGAVPTAMPPAQSDSFQLAGFGGGEAQRLQRPGGVRRAPEARPAPRVPMASRVMFGIGIASLLIAVTVWLVSGNGSETPAAEPPPAPASVAPPVTPPPTSPAAVTPVGAPAPTERPGVGKDSTPATARQSASAPAPVPIPAATTPKSDHSRTSATPAALRSPRRSRETKSDEGRPTGDDGVEATRPATKPPRAETPDKEAAPKAAPAKEAPAKEVPAKETPAKEVAPKAKLRPIDTDETLPPSEE
jgi:hypothetical protein